MKSCCQNRQYGSPKPWASQCEEGKETKNLTEKPNNLRRGIWKRYKRRTSEIRKPRSLRERGKDRQDKGERGCLSTHTFSSWVLYNVLKEISFPLLCWLQCVFGSSEPRDILVRPSLIGLEPKVKCKQERHLNSPFAFPKTLYQSPCDTKSLSLLM